MHFRLALVCLFIVSCQGKVSCLGLPHYSSLGAFQVLKKTCAESARVREKRACASESERAVLANIFLIYLFCVGNAFLNMFK